MPSIQTRALNGITRQAIRVTYRGDMGVDKVRSRYAKLDARIKVALPDGISIDDLDGPPAGRWLRNRRADKRVVLYLHGGAYVVRLLNGHSMLLSRICAELDASAFMAFYRLSPEHAFPAAPEDCLAAYRHLLDSGHAAKDIVVMGDSAGGNLALSLLHLIKREELPQPGACVALSPMTDFAQISATWRANARTDPMYPVQDVVAPQRLYLQGASPVDPVASPYYGDLGGFPPTLVVVGGIEALRDDATGFVRKAVESGVRARAHIWSGAPHVFMLQAFLPESPAALNRIRQWYDDVATQSPKADDPMPYAGAIEYFDISTFSGRVRRATNDVWLQPVTRPISPSLTQ
ncbi:MAG: alpha/beta hydrolase [Microthrixaceae bacterium]